jgi:hypothetical protein
MNEIVARDPRDIRFWFGLSDFHLQPHFPQSNAPANDFYDV